MKQQPLVSIVIPTYNRKSTIQRALESVFSQSYSNMEIILVDDGSTDGTDKITFEFARNNPGMVVIKNEVNLGIVKSLNRGIDAAKGKYIARLDDDDYWCDNQKIEKQTNFLEDNRDYVLVGGKAREVNSEGKETGMYLVPEKDVDIKGRILFGDAFIHVTVIFRKEAWKKTEGYDKNFEGIEDWDLWLKMGLLGKFYNFQEVFAVHTGHKKNSPSNFEKKYDGIKRLKLSLKLIKKYSGHYSRYRMAILYCRARYLYSLLPFKNQIRPALTRLRDLLRSPS